MGRRSASRGAIARVVVALILLSVSGSLPIPPSRGDHVSSGDGETIRAAFDEVPAKPMGPAIDVPTDALAVPTYPSSGDPRLWGERVGPFPLLANAILYHHFDDAYALGYRGAGVRVAVVDEGVDFGHPDLAGTQAVVTNASSPYVGWPMVYDPKSLASYLTTGYPDGTWYANTTRTGLGPFEDTHTIRVDGTNDFGEAERAGFDTRDKNSGDPGGVKADYDLTDLFVTRDAQHWYFGFPVHLDQQNASFVLLIDVDNGTSGAYVSPRNIPVDTNTSAAQRVNDVAWSPDGTKVATVSGDFLVRVWDRSGDIVFTSPPHPNEPLSVAWSPDGTRVASADKNWLRIWEATNGSLLRNIEYVPPGPPTITENGILAFSPNGTWVAAATANRVHIFNVVTGQYFGYLWPLTTSVNAVAFDPSGNYLAVALGNGNVRVYNTSRAIYNTGSAATETYRLAGHTQPVLDVAWSPDGTRIVSGARDNTAKLWDVAAQSVLQTMVDHQAWVMGTDWAPSGSYFVTTSRGLLPGVLPSLAIWNDSGVLVRLVPQGRAIGGVDWSSLNEIATASEDFTARLWTSGGDLDGILVAHRPDYALYVHGFSRYENRTGTFSHGTELADWYRWNESSNAWESTPLANLSGRQSAFQFGDALFNEFAVPRALLPGDPSAISTILYSTHEGGSRAQDTTPSDWNVNFLNLDFSPGWSSLSAFSWTGIESYTVRGITSASNTFHFGFHPGPAVQRRFGALGVLVADSAPGTYDRVYLDMNGDKVFDATDVLVTKASPIATIDIKDPGGNPNPDGFPDVSAGMIYYISDGQNPIPYSQRVVARKGAPGGPQMRTPAAGDLVAFAGEFGVDPTTAALAEHGTRMASAIVGRGNVMTGTASEASLVAVMNGLSDPIEAWTFAVEGYDGRPNTGDEALVVVSPFNFPTLHHDGWDAFSRTADYLSAVTSEGNATFVASAGDYGFGYGTVLSPASGPSVIAAGRAGDFSLRSSVWGGTEGPNPHVMDPAIPGSRGPSAQGFVKPELLGVDTAALAVPLHAAPDGSAAISSSPSQGSDVSAVVVAGAVAIMYDAFTARHGRGPKVGEVRAILMSGADDAGHDVLAQGAGFLNVSRSVKLAAEAADAGLEVTPPTWHPGTYRGVPYAGFTRLMFPGTWERTSFALRNPGSALITADLEAVTYAQTARYAHTNVTRTDAPVPPFPPYQPDGNIALWVNDSGLWKLDGATLTAVRLAAPVPGAWASADLVKVTAYSDLGRLTYKVDTSFFVNYSYTLRAYDWTIDWGNWFGIGPFPAPAWFPGELNTVAETFHQSNVLEVRAAFPASAIHDGLVVSLEGVDPLLRIEGLTWTFEVELYERVPWPWASLSASTVPVPAGGTATVTANLSVPANAAIGSYEAALLVQDPATGLTTTVPILVNVGAAGPRLTFGGNLLSIDLYDNNRLYGGYDRALASLTRLRRPAVGDWRFFFFDIPRQGVWDPDAPAEYKVLVSTSWIDAPSDVDIFAFGRTSADLASQGNSGLYNSFTLRQAGKSEELDKPEFKTATGAGEEVIAYDLTSGLNVIALRAFSMRGLEAEVRLVSGEAAWVNTPTAIDVATPFRRCDAANETILEGGCARFDFLSNRDLPALRASAVGPAQTIAFSDLEVRQDVQAWWNFPGWGEWMYRATFNYTFYAERALILEVAIQGKSDVSDLDLAVFRNPSGSPCVWDPVLEDPLTKVPGYWTGCVLDPEEYSVVDTNVWRTDADGDADEKVKWTLPPDGHYIVKVLGYTVLANPGHFDMQISVTLDTGTGYQVYESPKPAEIVNGTSPLPALTRVPMNMTWDFPADASDNAYGGAILLGLPNAPGVIVVPVVVLLDRRAPEITGLKVNALNGRLNAADNRTTNDRAPQLAVTVQDFDWGQLDRTSARMALDGTDMSGLTTVTISYLARNNKLGLWDGTLALTPPNPLPEGAHIVNASIGDRAGNVANASFSFFVDATGPQPFVLDGALLQYTRLDAYTVSGTVESGASVNVRGTWYVVPTGRFSIPVPLLEGTNALTVTAADWFEIDASGNPVAGNFATLTQTIVRDLVPPEFARWGAEPAGTTREDETVITGQVRDFLSGTEPGRPEDVNLTLTWPGLPTPTVVPVLADGTFRLVVPLQEGANPITATFTDLAGNVGSDTITVTSDTTAPSLEATVVSGATSRERVVTVRGTTDPGAFVTVNGIAIAVPNGTFSTTVALSPGLNLVVVQAIDIAGNSASRTLTVTYEPEAGLSAGLAAAIIVVGVVAGVVVAFLLVRAGVRIPGLSRKPPAGGTPPESAAEEAEPTEESPPAEEELSVEEEVEDPRVARLRQAYEDGKITEEVYEQNLRRIRGSGDS